ncbi:hypothetical protein [Rubrivirga sp.]|uniref:hypothetical protein n=1 Tax=Rubrivirga sp. TaxID=1885344 RepID=UPI003C796394
MRPALLALSIVTLAACSDSSDEPFDAAAYDGGSETEAVLEDDAVDPVSDLGDADPPGLERPQTTTGVISIEGEDEAIALRLVRYEDVSLPFSTYVPDGWTDEVSGSGEGTAVRFAMGAAPMQGVVSLFVPSDANQNDTVGLARAVAESRGGFGEFEDGEGPDWATAGFSFADDSGAGSVTVGEHDGTSFYIIEEFPYDMGDGFVPRAEMIQDRLVWLDDGTGL